MVLKWFFILFLVAFGICANAQYHPGIDSELPAPAIKMDFNNALDAETKNGIVKPFRIIPENTDSKELFESGIKDMGLKCGRDKETGKYYQYLWKNNESCSIKEGTVSLWVKPLDWDGSDSSAFRLFFCITNGNERIQICQPKGSSKIHFLLGSIASPAYLTADISKWRKNEWHLVTATWNPNSLSLYIDGEKIQSSANLKPIEKDFTHINLGSQLLNIENGLTVIDEVRIYPVSLTQGQVMQIASTHTDKIQRNSNMILPAAVGKVSIDGKITSCEYPFSSCLLYDTSTGNPTSNSVKYFISRDNDNLHVAFQSSTEKIKAEQMEKDGRIWEDDSVEIYIQTDIQKNDFYQFIVNSKDVFFDRVSSSQGSNWNCKNFRSISKIENGIWTVEIQIPFSSLEQKAPPSDSKWGLNLCRSFKDSIKPVYCSLAKSYADVPSFASLVFRDSMPAIEIQSIGNPVKGKLDFETKISAVKPNEKSEIICDISSSENGKLFFTQKRNLTTAPNMNSFKLTKDIPTSGQLKIEMSSANSDILYSSTINYMKKDLFNLKFLYTDIPKQILHVIAEASATGTEEILVQLLDKDDSVVLEHKQKLDERIAYDIPLDISKIPAGDYRVLLRKESQILEELFRKSLERPVWQDNKIGITDKVPAPWTDLNADSNSVSCWGRKYSFDNAFICSSITSQNGDILAKPMTLRVNGKAEYEKDSFIVKQLYSKPDEAKFHQEMRYGNLLVNSDIHVEFDGHVWVNMTLSPVDGKSVELSEIKLEIPLANASLVHNSKRGQQPGAIDASGAIPEKGWQKNLFSKPSFWVGNEEIGFNWFAENLKGWHCKDAERSMTIQKSGKAAIVYLSVVDTKMFLDKKREISFGFMATPSRPLNKLVMSDRNSQKFLPCTDFWTSYFDTHCDKDKINWKYISDPPKAFKSKERLFYYSSYKGASPLTGNWAYWGKLWMRNPPDIGTYYTDLPVSKKEERNKGCWTYGCLRCKNFLDYKIWDFNTILSDPNCKIQDWYFDLAAPLMCDNSDHGCQWTDDFGRKHMTFDLLATRELAKRIYVLIKSKNPNALISQHLEGRRTSVMSFADSAVDGEDFVPEVAASGSYYDLLTPDYVKAAFNPVPWGVQIANVSQIYRSLLLRAPAKAAAWKETPEIKQACLHFLAYIMLHNSDVRYDLWKYTFIINPLWAIQDKMGMDETVKFIPYWSKDKSIVTSPVSDRILASAFVKENKLLLVVLNDTDKTQDVSVKLDLKSMMPSFKISSEWKGTEAFSQESEPVIKNGIYSTKLPARNMRLIYWE